MIKVEKQVSITIDGEDIQSLADVCEMARRYVSEHKRAEKSDGRSTEWEIGEYDNKAFIRITNFLGEIFTKI